MSKTEHAGPHKRRQEEKRNTDDEHQSIIAKQPWSCALSCAGVHERVHVYLICFQEHLVRDFEMQVSTRRKVCLYEHRRMFSTMLPGTLNDFFFLSVGDPGRS